MADVRKEQEREELHRTIWAIADDLRGSVDGWDFKTYVLGTMFYRYISENLTEYINKFEIEAGNTEFDYALLADDEAEAVRADMVNEKGFFILPSELFKNICANAEKLAEENKLNEVIETVFRHIEQSAQGTISEAEFSGLFDDYDVNSNKLGASVPKRKGSPIVNYMDVYKKTKIYLKDLSGRVAVTDKEIERYNVKRGDVFFTRTSETKEEIGIAAVCCEDIPNGVFSGFVLRARPKTDLLLPEYCAYCFSSSEVRKFIVRYSTYTTRALTNGNILSNLIIAVPPIDVQKRIVYVLDNFEAICSDLKIGLPAEIDARQKQYEYYRDLLLNFNSYSQIVNVERERERERERSRK